MTKTSTVRALIDPQKKEKVSKILRKMGLTHSEAINIFYSLIEEYKGFPFELRLPVKKVNNTEENIEPELIAQLKESIRKNRKLGELLAR
jgi:DNA-damage-inducible protein J